MSGGLANEQCRFLGFMLFVTNNNTLISQIDFSYKLTIEGFLNLMRGASNFARALEILADGGAPPRFNTVKLSSVDAFQFFSFTQPPKVRERERET